MKKVLTGGSIKCSNEEFGDVAPGKPKSCFCNEAKEPLYKLPKEFAAEKCADEGGIEALIKLVRQPEEQLQALALAALRHLSTLDSLKQPIVQARAVRPALRAITNTNEDIYLQVGLTLY